MGALTPLLVVGAGGLGREVAEAVRAANEVSPRWELLGFLDDAPSAHSIDGVPVLGPIERAREMTDAMVVVCVGSPLRNLARQAVVDRLGLARDRFATVVHPAAVLPPSTQLGPGSVVLAAVVATTGVTIGAHAVLMPGTILTHDDVLGDYVTCASGVRLAGGVHVGDGAYIGAATTVREHVDVGAGAVIGTGSVVLTDVPAGEVWAGAPARFLRRLDVESTAGAR